jgi:CBS domain-containing protein
MTEKLARRGVAVPAAYHADPLRTTAVRDVMTAEVATITVGTPASAAEALGRQAGHRTFPVVDRWGGLVGIVGRSDLLDAPDPTAPVEAVATAAVVTVGPDEVLHTALRRMVDEDVDHLPVVADGRVVGMFTRSDLLKARARQFEHDHPEAGWLAALPRVTPRARRGSLG